VVIGWVMVVLGLAGVVAAGLAWTGRWRAWSRRVLTGPLVFPITLLPGLGLALIGLGLGQAGVVRSTSPVPGVGALCAVVGMILYFWSPGWFGPRWLRRERADGIEPDLSEPLTALSYAALAPVAGRPSSAEQALARSGGGEVLERWTATWVVHEDGGDKPHGLGRAGAVGGKLELYDRSVVFRAGEIEDRLRDVPTVAVIERDRVRGARVVPRGAGPDGVRRKGRGPRSAFARLVVDADDGAYLFEVNGAKAKARRIEEVLGR